LLQKCREINSLYTICTSRKRLCVNLFLPGEKSTEINGIDLIIPEKVNPHSENMNPVLNKTQCHEDAWGSGGIAPYILNLGTRLR